MNVGDILTIFTGCGDCGDVTSRIMSLAHYRALVEVISELPHNAKERNIWIDTSRLRLRDA